MGQMLDCACLEHMPAFSDDDEAKSKERIDGLKKGDKFVRNVYLGLSKQDLFVKLSENCSGLQWNTENNTWSNAEKGEIDLTSQVKKLRSSRDNGLQIIGLDDSVLLEIQAAEVGVRDHWLVSLTELMHSWTDHPETRPKSAVTAQGSSNKAEYFKQREAELKAREKANEERKAKYAAGGMKHTAAAMANRA
ncbi:hypothetical protein B484DRAFT_450884 [Ochromonadaceae sp. CCMP2298]|nr:hypothetical protein B484DRAFT_450884 [Ochromonadaceae sp. CCMP2298]|mmetsp:Transcript_21947/g.48776  ORF Transcript_21947/g.48776 Transcript_21947/m.48776 type:complete len:192 (+) Transcript_21947:173-748(+)